MKPGLVDRGPAIIAGIERDYDSERDGPSVFSELWEKRFWPRYAEIESLCDDKGFYGVWSGGIGGGGARYLAGAAVTDRSRVPGDLTVVEVPAGRYAVFECTVATIGATYGRIFGEGSPRPSLQLDASRPHFEYYPPGTASGDAPALIYVPVVEGRAL